MKAQVKEFPALGAYRKFMRYPRINNFTIFLHIFDSEPIKLHEVIDNKNMKILWMKKLK